MTVPEFVLACLHIGLTMCDIERYKVGTLLNLFSVQENINRKAKAEAEKKDRKGREATQSDIEAFARL